LGRPDTLASTPRLDPRPDAPHSAQTNIHLSRVSIQPFLPASSSDALVRVLATNDLLGTLVPMPATYGEGGSISGVVELFERSCESIPTVWVDSGDLTLGVSATTFGQDALLEMPPLPISVAAVGNHELESNAAQLRDFASRVPFTLLSADRDVGLAATAMLDTPQGLIGIVGMTHPFAHEFSLAPPPDTPAAAIAEHAGRLRRDGARWVLALVHYGANWWASPCGRWVEARAGALQQVTSQWASAFDAILGGHTLAAWTGKLHGTPAGHAHSYAASVLPVDLCANPPYVRIREPTRVPPITPASSTPTVELLQRAAQRPVGELAATWGSRPGAWHYLPNLLAEALRRSTGADAAFVPPGHRFTQAPLDGSVAALRAGTVTELDILRLHPFLERVEILELEPGEFQKLVARHDAAADPANALADTLWWNWARAPAGVASTREDPTTVAVQARGYSPLPGMLLGRDLTAHQSDVSFRQATTRLVAEAGSREDLASGVRDRSGPTA
jgi:2',3'-cyclic-nucleotide 2'-phosphodiesterase (5'-nucleotidase family)